MHYHNYVKYTFIPIKVFGWISWLLIVIIPYQCKRVKTLFAGRKDDPADLFIRYRIEIQILLEFRYPTICTQ